MLFRSRTVLPRNLLGNISVGLTMIAAAALIGCGGSKPEVTPTAEPAATQAQQAAAPQYTVDANTTGSVVEGRVMLQGAPPKPKKIEVTQDAGTCGKTREVSTAHIENGGVDDAVVWIDDIQHGKAFGFPPAEMAQKGCAYVPHVMIMPPGDLKITSQDPIPHNVHTYAPNNREYNESMNALRKEISLTFARADVISVKCDLHGWMQAYIVIAKNPYYALTASGGKFQLEGVPAGQYHLHVWSESLGESDQPITVQAGQPTKADFTLKSPAAQGLGGN